MVRQTATVITFELLGGLLLLVMAAAGFLAFSLANGPVELAIFRDDIEDALTRARSGREVSVDRLTLEWSTSQRRVLVAAEGLTLLNDEGDEAGHANHANIEFDAGSLIYGEVEVLELHLADGWMNLRNTAPNKWELAGEPLPEIRTGVLPTTLEGWLNLTNRTFTDVLEGLQVRQRDATLEAVTFEDFDLILRNRDESELARLSNAAGGLERDGDELVVMLKGEGGGVGLPGAFEIAMTVSDAYRQLKADIQLSNLMIADVLKRLSLDEFVSADMNADLMLAFDVERGTGITQAALSTETGAGTLEAIGQTLAVEGLKVDTVYNTATDTLIVSSADVQTDLVSGVFEGRLENLLRTSATHDFELTSDAMSLDLTPYFPEVWSFARVATSGSVDDTWSLLEIERVAASVGEARAVGEGRIDFGPDRDEGELPLAATFNAQVTGPLDASAVLDFWPKTLGAGARVFAETNIKAGQLESATAVVNIKPDSLAQGYLRDEDLKVIFDVTGAEVTFMDDLPPVANATGTGTLTGNSFKVVLSDGTYGGWDLSEGTVDFPALNPKGELFTVQAKGSGPLVDVMRNLSDSRLQLEAKSGFDPERLSGDAQMEFRMSRPALSNVTMDDIDISVIGTVENASLSGVIMGMDLKEVSAGVDVTGERIIVTGNGDLGPAPVQFTWRDGFGDGEGGSDLSASAIVDADLLNRFGITGRAYLAGDIPVEMQARLEGQALDSAEFSFDLSEARIDLQEIGWLKPAGSPARATVSYGERDGDVVSAVRLLSPDVELDGDLRLAPGGALERLDLNRFFMAGRADVSGTLKREDDGIVSVEVNGPYLDVSPFLGNVSSMGSEAGGLKFPLSVSADVDRLRLREGLDLVPAVMSLQTNTTSVQSFIASGETPGGDRMRVQYTGESEGEAATLSLNSGNAGFLTSALLGSKVLEGGTLELDGKFAFRGDPTKLLLKVKDARLRDAPFLTQVLSLASLRGLADTLGGDGVLFSDIEVPMTIAGGRYIVEGGRANGPALGLTANGWLAQKGGDIDVTGVLVPSFGVNSMLGGVPVIGDLFVGREGEGIFSLTYSVRGTLEKAQVAVNPLSAVTPGVLRRIFENPADTDIPDSLPIDRNLTPPAPPMSDDAEMIETAPIPGR